MTTKRNSKGYWGLPCSKGPNFAQAASVTHYLDKSKLMRYGRPGNLSILNMLIDLNLPGAVKND